MPPKGQAPPVGQASLTAASQPAPSFGSNDALSTLFTAATTIYGSSVTDCLAGLPAGSSATSASSLPGAEQAGLGPRGLLQLFAAAVTRGLSLLAASLDPASHPNEPPQKEDDKTTAQACATITYMVRSLQTIYEEGANTLATHTVAHTLVVMEITKAGLLPALASGFSALALALEKQNLQAAQQGQQGTQQPRPQQQQQQAPQQQAQQQQPAQEQQQLEDSEQQAQPPPQPDGQPAGQLPQDGVPEQQQQQPGEPDEPARSPLPDALLVLASSLLGLWAVLATHWPGKLLRGNALATTVQPMARLAMAYARSEPAVINVPGGGSSSVTAQDMDAATAAATLDMAAAGSTPAAAGGSGGGVAAVPPPPMPLPLPDAGRNPRSGRKGSRKAARKAAAVASSSGGGSGSGGGAGAAAGAAASAGAGAGLGGAPKAAEPAWDSPERRADHLAAPMRAGWQLMRALDAEHRDAGSALLHPAVVRLLRHDAVLELLLMQLAFVVGGVVRRRRELLATYSSPVAAVTALFGSSTPGKAPPVPDALTAAAAAAAAVKAGWPASALDAMPRFHRQLLEQLGMPPWAPGLDLMRDYEQSKLHAVALGCLKALHPAISSLLIARPDDDADASSSSGGGGRVGSGGEPAGSGQQAGSGSGQQANGGSGQADGGSSQQGGSDSGQADGGSGQQADGGSGQASSSAGDAQTPGCSGASQDSSGGAASPASSSGAASGASGAAPAAARRDSVVALALTQGELGMRLALCLAEMALQLPTSYIYMTCIELIVRLYESVLGAHVDVWKQQQPGLDPALALRGGDVPPGDPQLAACRCVVCRFTPALADAALVRLGPGLLALARHFPPAPEGLSCDALMRESGATYQETLLEGLERLIYNIGHAQLHQPLADCLMAAVRPHTAAVAPVVEALLRAGRVQRDVVVPPQGLPRLLLWLPNVLTGLSDGLLAEPRGAAAAPQPAPGAMAVLVSELSPTGAPVQLFSLQVSLLKRLAAAQARGTLWVDVLQQLTVIAGCAGVQASSRISGGGGGSSSAAAGCAGANVLHVAAAARALLLAGRTLGQQDASSLQAMASPAQATEAAVQRQLGEEVGAGVVSFSLGGLFHHLGLLLTWLHIELPLVAVPGDDDACSLRQQLQSDVAGAQAALDAAQVAACRSLGAPPAAVAVKLAAPCAALAERLQAAGAALTGALPLWMACNNPGCTVTRGHSEWQLVVGVPRCVCAGCASARYCCPGCQTAHWRQHRPACKRISAARAGAAPEQQQ